MIAFVNYTGLVDSSELSLLTFITKTSMPTSISSKKAFVLMLILREPGKNTHHLIINTLDISMVYITELKILFHYSLFSLNSYLKPFWRGEKKRSKCSLNVKKNELKHFNIFEYIK